MRKKTGCELGAAPLDEAVFPVATYSSVRPRHHEAVGCLETGVNEAMLQWWWLVVVDAVMG